MFWKRKHFLRFAQHVKIANRPTRPIGFNFHTTVERRFFGLILTRSGSDKQIFSNNRTKYNLQYKTKLYTHKVIYCAFFALSFIFFALSLKLFSSLPSSLSFSETETLFYSTRSVVYTMLRQFQTHHMPLHVFE